jgi:beta-mannosidase
MRAMQNGRRSVSLGGLAWELGSVDPKSWDASDIYDVGAVKEWLPATVPGDVRVDLMAAGRIADPFFGDQAQASTWVDGLDWWVRTRLPVKLEPNERAFLVCEGIDYLSAVYGNGQLLGRHEGMFSRQVYEVTDLGRRSVSGEWEFSVRLWGNDEVRLLSTSRLTAWERLLARLDHALQPNLAPFAYRAASLKANYGFGWDFAPSLPSLGIWDDIYLVFVRGVYLADAWVRAEPQGETGARVQVRLETDADAPRHVAATLTIRPRNFGGPAREFSFALEMVAGRQNHLLTCDLQNVQRWEPWERGFPHLYELEITLRAPDTAEVLDSLTIPFGIRTVEREPDAPWVFRINGDPLFLRGANWVPLDMFPGRLRAADYAAMVRQAKEMGINFLRVWGGGLREKRAFYDACDAAGILVWQEFPFACAFVGRFASAADYRALVRQEARAIVRALRNHPSLFLWCGGNEFGPRRNAALVEILAATVAEEDGTRPWHPASPGAQESHNWAVWHRRAPAAAYHDDYAACISEFGLAAVPDLSSLERFLLPVEQWLPGEGWRQHHAQINLLWHYACMDVLGESRESLKAFIVASQRAQAHGLQVGIEAFRRRKYDTGVIAFWMLGEPWPAFSWSVIDYYRRPKLACRMLQRAYQPLLISLDYPLRAYRLGDHVKAGLWVVNDTLSSYAGCQVCLWLDEVEIYCREVNVEPDGCQRIGDVRFTLGSGPWLLRAELRRDGAVLAENLYDLRQPNPRGGLGFLGRLRQEVGRWLLR